MTQLDTNVRASRFVNGGGARRMRVSFEFFPPKTEEMERTLWESISRLAPLAPNFVSVTYGAGGSTRERTHDLVVRIHRETNLTTVSHLTCVCHTREELSAILDRYADSGIENVLALAGDPATGLPIGDTKLNLKAAIHGETHEYTDMYPGMAKTAREEGFTEIADWFETLARAEKSHAGRFQKGLDTLG